MPTSSVPSVAFVPARLDLTIHQGDTPTLIFHFGMDLTGFTVRAQARIAPESRSLLFSFVIEMLDEGLGDFTMRPPAEGSAQLPLKSFWDLEIQDPTGNLRTILAGQIHSPRQVTRV